MSLSLVVHDSLSTEKRSSILTCPRRPRAIPVPPSLLNSPYLSSPNSVFRQKSAVPRWPSQQDNDWLRDMVPIDRSSASDQDAKSELSSGPPSPTSSDTNFGCVLVPPSPMLRARSTTPDMPMPIPIQRATCGPGAGHGQA